VLRTINAENITVRTGECGTLVSPPVLGVGGKDDGRELPMRWNWTPAEIEYKIWLIIGTSPSTFVQKIIYGASHEHIGLKSQHTLTYKSLCGQACV